MQVFIQKYRLSYENGLVSKFSKNKKKLYSYLKSLSKSSPQPQLLIHNSTPINDQNQIAELFNSFFNSTFTNSDYSLPPIDSLPSPSLQLNKIEINSSDVYTALSKLDPTKAMGHDNINPKILKFCALALADPITSLFSKCLKSGNIPSEWKVHKICPVHKKGSKLDVKNFRPISLLCIISKVLESLIYDKVINFIRPLLSVRQFGFLNNRSCLTQLLTSFSEIFQSIDDKKVTDVVYFDFRKAFDSVPHDELLFKLWSLGITGELWFWFKNYLKNRTHYVSIDGSDSNYKPVISGVPQG